MNDTHSYLYEETCNSFAIIDAEIEKTILSVRKVQINPKKLREIRTNQQKDSVLTLETSGAKLIDIFRGKKADPVWKLFKNIDIKGVRYGGSKMFCSLCWENGKIKPFSENTSLSVLKVHMENKHDKKVRNPRMKVAQKLFSDENQCKTNENYKEDLVTYTSLMFIMLNIPFNEAKSPYFVNWLERYQVIKSQNEAPSPKSLSDCGLERLYQAVHDQMIIAFQDSPNYIVAVFDAWMDVSKKHYLAIIIRFLTSKFETTELVVAFRHLEYKDADTESEILRNCVTEFKLQDKKLLGLSDRGSDMLKLCRIEGMNHNNCVAHGLHNLLNTDVIPKVPMVKNFLKKLHAILSAFRYRLYDLKTDLELEHDSQNAKLLKQFAELDQQLEGEKLILPWENTDDNSNVLRRDVVTRWTSTYEMLSSFSGQTKIVNMWLTYIQKHGLLIKPQEENLLKHLIRYFKTFMKVTKSLEGSNCTINLAFVMFIDLKCELEQQLNELFVENDTNAVEVRQMYRLTLNNLEKRFIISDEMLCATILDPGFQHLDQIQDLLKIKSMNKVQFITQMFQKYVGEPPLAPIRDQLTKSNSIREQLVLKHQLSYQNGTLEKELKSFETIDNNFDDLLCWYGTVGIHQFPLLSKLARVILQISATSATIERLNSRARRIMTCERTNLSTQKFNKMMIVQYNYPILKTTEIQ